MDVGGAKQIKVICSEDKHLDDAGKINYHTLKPVLFEFPTYEYLKTGEVIGKCLSFILVSVLICKMICFSFRNSGNLLANHLAQGYKNGEST